MILSLLLLAQAVPAGPAAPTAEERYDACVDAATDDPARGEQLATQWRLAGGGFLARQCLGMSYANRQQWSAAATAFTEAAREAEVAKDRRAANYWAQAGNAHAAQGTFTEAGSALDAALAAGTLRGLELGEAHLDRARVRVAMGDNAGARADIDRALMDAKDDPLAWLLSATLARRTGDLKRAQVDIAEAVRRAADDASVQLEAGNVAALSGDEAAARAAWQRVVAIAPEGAQAASARTALAQFAEPSAGSGVVSR